MAVEISVDYLGGDPDAPSAPLSGKLATTAEGFKFAALVMRGVTPEEIMFAIPEEEVRAISHGDANHIRGLTRAAAGVLVGGTIGGLVGMMTGRRNTMLVLACSRAGFEFSPAFACTADEGRWLVNELQRSRRDRGLDAVPLIEQLASRAASAAADGQAELMVRILSQLEQQTELLRRIAERS